MGANSSVSLVTIFTEHPYNGTFQPCHVQKILEYYDSTEQLAGDEVEKFLHDFWDMLKKFHPSSVSVKATQVKEWKETYDKNADKILDADELLTLLNNVVRDDMLPGKASTIDDGKVDTSSTSPMQVVVDDSVGAFDDLPNFSRTRSHTTGGSVSSLTSAPQPTSPAQASSNSSSLTVPTFAPFVSLSQRHQSPLTALQDGLNLVQAVLTHAHCTPADMTLLTRAFEHFKACEEMLENHDASSDLKKEYTRDLRKRRGSANKEDKEMIEWVQRQFFGQRSMSQETSAVAKGSSSARTTPTKSVDAKSLFSGRSTPPLPPKTNRSSTPQSSSSSTSSSPSPGAGMQTIFSPKGTVVGMLALKGPGRQSATRRRAVSAAVAKALEVEEDEARLQKDLVQLASIVQQPPVMSYLDKILDWQDFDIFEFTNICEGMPLSVLVPYLFQYCDFFNLFGVDPEALKRFIRSIEVGYKDTPYHNHIHATDVVHNAFYFVQAQDVVTKLNAVDVMAAIIAAAIHDYAHPGTNNEYLINSNATWATVYNDTSVLENMHCSQAFFIMRQEGFDIFSGLDAKLRKETRRSIIAMVLGTDMANHGDIMAKLQSTKDANRVLERTEYDDRQLAMTTIVHAADLGNPSKPLHLYLEWTDRVFQEFFAQGDLEKKMGLPISPLCNRETTKIKGCQFYFMDMIVKPYFQLFMSVVGDDISPELQVCLKQMTENRAYWDLPDADLKASRAELETAVKKLRSVSTKDDDDYQDQSQDDL